MKMGIKHREPEALPNISSRDSLADQRDYAIFRARVGSFHAMRNRIRRANISRAQKNDVMRSLGLVKVRGALGGIYWE